MHLIVAGNEKGIYFENSKRKISWVDLGAPSTSTPKSNRFGRKTVFCVWWDKRDVVNYGLLKTWENG